MANQITVSSYWHNKTLNEKKKSIHTTHKIIASPEHTWCRKENCYCVPSRIKIKTSLTCICGVQFTQRNRTTIEKNNSPFQSMASLTERENKRSDLCSFQNLMYGSQEIRGGNTSGDWTPESKVVTPPREQTAPAHPQEQEPEGFQGRRREPRMSTNKNALYFPASFSISPPFYRQWLGKLRIPVNKRQLIGIITWQI